MLQIRDLMLARVGLDYESRTIEDVYIPSTHG
jgi:hypothetical protein